MATLHSQYKQDIEQQTLLAGKIKPAVDLALGSVMSVFNLCDECWAVNSAIRDLYINEYGLTAAEEVNRTYEIPSDATVFLFVGRINFIKNIDFTVRALAMAKKMGLKNSRPWWSRKD